MVLDERCVVTPAGEKMLLRVSDEAPAASIGLIEPWATVEGAYSGAQRVGPARGGRMLVVIEQGAGVGGLADLIAEAAQASWCRSGLWHPSQRALSISWRPWPGGCSMTSSTSGLERISSTA